LDQAVLVFRVLGQLEVERDGVPVRLGGAKQQAVLALLLLEEGRPLSTERLIEGLWGSRPPRSAAKAVQLYVSQLRKLLGVDAIATRGDAYVFPTSPGSLDLRDFERLAGEGRAQAAAGRHAEAARLFAEASRVWRGEALAGLDEPGLVAPRARLEELRLLVHELWLDARLQLGEHADLVPELAMLARRHPLRERLQEQLMLALYRDGRQADALDVYRQLRGTLHDQLGLEPHARIRDLQLAILRQDAALDAAAPAVDARTLVAAAADPALVAHLLIPLAQSLAAELILLAPVGSREALPRAVELLEGYRAPGVRVAAFVTDDTARDVGRLAQAEGAELVVLAGSPGDELPALACDVVLLVDSGGARPADVSVLFDGSDADWRALELAAVLARSLDATLRLVGSEAASALLARAAIVVQRFAGVATVPALFDRDARSLANAAAGSVLVATGVPAADLGVPLLVLRAGVRPGLLAPAETMTHFSWSLLG
jgi:DNA-binding SARP family transcriptional activator